MNPWLDSVFILLATDLREFFRTRLIIPSSSVMPVMMTLAFGLAGPAIQTAGFGDTYFEFIFPSILALATMFSATFAAGYVVILDRQKGVIRDMMLSPAPYSAYVVGRLAGIVLKSIPPLLITLAVAAPLLSGWPWHLLPLFGLVFVLTSVQFAALGMIVGAYSNVMTFSGWANLYLMPFMFFCAVFFPLEAFGSAGWLVQFVPFTSSVQLFLYAVSGERPLHGIGINLILLFGYTVVFSLVWTVVL
uniref:ABC-type multidrug transport system, permease component n=1 Tax=Candidatus Kentrum sp. MB TaxID=2138164 RepID=A0A450X8K3_9GAMM|nr:MAG: ABC-type multidrug transport system, permease component [Candidatus Kentron sp. MB]VFK29661.1 MAG: ABC-type multidrug transport system, permease component [Candidatus Kentron sp. MB]VFK74861.1 MAG: ABC-type multidrug transport system, permease component [Candidatus Kentron sp. MB]